MTTKKKAETKAEPEAPAPVAEKNNTLAHPVDRSILLGPTSGDLNPAFEVETD